MAMRRRVARPLLRYQSLTEALHKRLPQGGTVLVDHQPRPGVRTSGRACCRPKASAVPLFFPRRQRGGAGVGGGPCSGLAFPLLFTPLWRGMRGFYTAT
jgi:hypothetical protein